MRLAVALGLAIAIVACSDSSPEPAELTDEQLGNATYPIEASLAPVTLTDGFFRSTDIVPAETQLHDARGFGQLNGDDAIDAAVVLSTRLGGTGNFYELVAVLNNDGEPDPVATVSLGDRVPVQTVEIVNRQIVVKLRVHGPGDGACCPSVEATRIYELTGSTLALVSQTP